MTLDLITLKKLAIISIFAVLFGTAAIDKLKTLSVPAWFIKQFESTLIAKLPGGVSLGYWMIASLEFTLFAGFLLAIVWPMLLPLALTGSLFLFAALCFGLRLASDFQGSANMFIYFASTLISLSAI
ncbi:MAG: hypothetical protein KA715_05845 [Xanthomonadaceae bacterium]|nr:hypothetical protein [Xanthomonadaceae bacterium]